MGDEQKTKKRSVKKNEMKIWSIITFLVFLNFTALPGVAAVFGWDLPQTNVVINEEENHSSSFVVYEKTIPKTLDVFDYLKFCEAENFTNQFVNFDEHSKSDPYLSIFSPPPEA